MEGAEYADLKLTDDDKQALAGYKASLFTERKKLVMERGRQGFFHYNAIINWHVDSDGFVSHVYDKDETTKTDSDISIDSDWN